MMSSPSWMSDACAMVTAREGRAPGPTTPPHLPRRSSLPPLKPSAVCHRRGRRSCRICYRVFVDRVPAAPCRFSSRPRRPVRALGARASWRVVEAALLRRVPVLFFPTRVLWRRPASLACACRCARRGAACVDASTGRGAVRRGRRCPPAPACVFGRRHARSSPLCPAPSRRVRASDDGEGLGSGDRLGSRLYTDSHR